MNQKYKERKRQQYKDEKFLNELGREMREQDNNGQASPRFWVIRDSKWVSAANGYGDRATIFSTDDYANWTDPEEFIKWYIDFEEFENLVNEHGLESVAEFMQLDDLMEIVGFLESDFNDNDYFHTEEQEIQYTKEDTMFLTKKEAEEHLKENGHHYSEKAHTYSMTAWRAPKVGKLLRALERRGV